MDAYKCGSHTVWDCKYHLVWGTKYRYQVLGGDVGNRYRELLRGTARAHEMVVHAGSINRDHAHMLVSIPPNLSRSYRLLCKRLPGNGQPGGAISERAQVAQAVERVRNIAQAVLGLTPVSARQLGRQCDRARFRPPWVRCARHHHRRCHMARRSAIGGWRSAQRSGNAGPDTGKGGRLG